MRLTFSTHDFATAVLADTQAASCLVLMRLLSAKYEGVASADVANWVFLQYPDWDVYTSQTARLGSRVIRFYLHGTHRPQRRKEMAERLLSCPDRRASITLIKP